MSERIKKKVKRTGRQIIMAKEKEIEAKIEDIKSLKQINRVRLRRIKELLIENEALKGQILKMFYTLRSTVPDRLFDYFVRKFTKMGGILVKKAEEKKPYILIDYRGES